MFYSGVTSENAVSTATCSGTRSLTYYDSWNALNDALVQTSFPDKVFRVVSSFFYTGGT